MNRKKQGVDMEIECIPSFHLVSLLKAFHPAHRVHYPLFTCIKGVAFAAYFYPDFWLS